MSDPTEPLQAAAAAALLASAEVLALVATAPIGGGQAPAVFADQQPYPPDAFPRITLWPPELHNIDGGCGQGWEAIFTAHCWGRGPAASLDAGKLAGAAAAALGLPLDIDGYRCVVGVFLSSRPVGDPDPAVEHIVSMFRYIVRPAA